LARRTGSAAHLSDAAQALLLERLIAGDNDGQVCAVLIEAGHLKPGDSLSRMTLYRYKRDPRYLDAVGVLSREAQDAGLRALARATLLHADIVEASARVILTLDGELGLADIQKFRAACRALEVSSKFLIDKLASGDLVTALRGLLERAEGGGARDERLRAELKLEILTLYNGTLRQMLAEVRGGTERGASVAGASAPSSAGEEGAAPDVSGDEE
jgi:hypothetical protein